MLHSTIVNVIPERPWVRVLPLELEPSVNDVQVQFMNDTINTISANNTAQCTCCLFCHAKTSINTYCPLPIICSFCSGHCGKRLDLMPVVPVVIQDLDLLQIQLQISMQLQEDHQQLQQQLKQLFYQIGKSCS